MAPRVDKTNPTPSTSATKLKKMLVNRLPVLQNMGKIRCIPPKKMNRIPNCPYILAAVGTN